MISEIQEFRRLAKKDDIIRWMMMTIQMMVHDGTDGATKTIKKNFTILVMVGVLVGGDEVFP